MTEHVVEHVIEHVTEHVTEHGTESYQGAVQCCLRKCGGVFLKGRWRVPLQRLRRRRDVNATASLVGEASLEV